MLSMIKTNQAEQSNAARGLEQPSLRCFFYTHAGVRGKKREFSGPMSGWPLSSPIISGTRYLSATLAPLSTRSLPVVDSLQRPPVSQSDESPVLLSTCCCLDRRNCLVSAEDCNLKPTMKRISRNSKSESIVIPGKTRRRQSNDCTRGGIETLTAKTHAVAESIHNLGRSMPQRDCGFTSRKCWRLRKVGTGIESCQARQHSGRPSRPA